MGYGEETGPTGVTVDGKYQIVDVGQTDRMKNDGAHALGNQLAEILMEMQDLENVQVEAKFSGDRELVGKIDRKLAALETKAKSLAEQHRRKPQL